MIAIKGMKMPSGCAGCPCSYDSYDYCNNEMCCHAKTDDRGLWLYVPMDFQGRPDWCPLVEVKDDNS